MDEYYYKLFIKIMVKIQEEYSYLSFKKYSIPQIIKKFEIKFKNCKSKNEFINLLTQVINLFEDPHMYFQDLDNKKYYSSKFNKTNYKNYDHKLLYKKYLKGKLIYSSNLGVIANYNDILYVNFFSWLNQEKNEILKLLTLFKRELELNKSKKIIIDLRSNSGGDDRISRLLLEIFIPKNKKILIGTYKFRLDKLNPEKIGNETKIIENNKSEKYFELDLSILIGNDCMSSNEYIIQGFESLRNIDENHMKRINLIGDKTFGSSGNPKSFKFDNLIEIMIPSWISYDRKGELFEEKGVEPNIKIKSKKSISWGKDKVFEKAVEILEKD